MRRTVGLAVVAATVLALAGIAAAQTVREGSAERPTGLAGAASGAVSGLGDATGDTVGRALGAAVPAAGLGRTGRTQVGTVERITRLLTGRGEAGSTTFHYPGSQYVKVHLTRAMLGAGDEVIVSDPAGNEVHRYDARALSDPAGRWAMSVTGDTAVVTAYGGAVEVDQVARGFTAAERAAREETPREREPGQAGRLESVCGGDDKHDAVCYRSSDPVAYRRSKAVVRLLINGSELCTGWRLGPTNQVVTNQHCFAESRAAHNTEVWFNYQCAACGGFAVFQPTKVWGERVLATDRTLDLTVFTVTNFDQVRKFGYLHLELDRPSPGDEVFIPQHPEGDPTVIAARSDSDRNGTCAVVDPAYDGFARDSDVSYHCDTEGGSSGSPVMSRRTGKVIALHHFGGCPNSGVRADLIHRYLQSLR